MSSASQFLTRARTIACIGRNYAAHAKELNNAVPTKPFFFLKPPSCMISPGQSIQVVPDQDVHHEIELAVIIGEPASRVRAEDAMKCVGGYALAIDLTARDLQSAAKKKGLPWAASKGQE
jgi:acylpyruvate hydrolase